MGPAASKATRGGGATGQTARAASAQFRTFRVGVVERGEHAEWAKSG